MTCVLQWAGNPGILNVGPDWNTVQEIKVGTKSKIMDMVAIRLLATGAATQQGGEKTTMIILCEDGSLNIYKAGIETTKYWLQTNLKPVGAVCISLISSSGSVERLSFRAGQDCSKTHRLAWLGVSDKCVENNYVTVQRGGWNVKGGLMGGHPPPECDLVPVDKPLVKEVKKQETSLSEIMNQEPVGRSFDSCNTSSESCEFQLADDCGVASRIMEAIYKVSDETESNKSVQDVYNFNDDDKEVPTTEDKEMPAHVSQDIVKGRNCCDNMCHSQELNMQILAVLDDIKKKSNKEKKQYFLDHLKKQEELDVTTHGFQFYGKFFCRKSLSSIFGVSDYILKEASKAFESGQVTFVHGNEMGMRECESSLGFIIWMKQHAERFGNFAPDESVIILSSCYSLIDLFKTYQEESPVPQIQSSTFYRLFKSKFGPYRVDKSQPQIRISSYSKHSKCDQCIILEKYQRSCKNREDLDMARSLKQAHKLTYKKAYQAIQEKRYRALYEADDHIFIQGMKTFIVIIIFINKEFVTVFKWN